MEAICHGNPFDVFCDRNFRQEAEASLKEVRNRHGSKMLDMMEMGDIYLDNYIHASIICIMYNSTCSICIYRFR